MSVIIALVPFIIGGSISTVSATALAVELATENNTVTEQKSLVIPSTIRNKDLLNKTLTNLGAKNIIYNTGQLEGSIDNFHIAFEENRNGTLDVKFIGEIEPGEAQKFVDELQTEYGKVVQEFVYLKLKEKAVEKGLNLEQEKVQNDQSIVLTYNING